MGGVNNLISLSHALEKATFYEAIIFVGIVKSTMRTGTAHVTS